MSSRTDLGGRYDAFVKRGDGNADHDVIAQTDLTFWLSKDDLASGQLRGTVMTDTLVRIRRTLRRTIES